MMSIPSPHMESPHFGTSPHANSPPDMGSPHIDIRADLFPDYYGGTTSIPSEAKVDSLSNDIPNGSNEPQMKENNFAFPVQPCTGGEGLPYAPVDWPNPGDIWSWRVGKRVNAAGFYNDRFLTVPKSLRKPNCPKVFASKQTLERFLRSLFPDADLDAFFASFVWKVPANLDSPTKGNSVPPAAVGMEGAGKGSKKRTPRSSAKKKTPQPQSQSQSQSQSHSSSSRKKQKTTKEPARSTRQTRQHLKNSSPPPPEPEDTSGGLDMSFLDDEKTREEFDNYLSSLDDILAQPLAEDPFPLAVVNNPFSAEDEMAEARIKLSSLLDMDFPSLICFKDLDELTSLASKLKKDPTLTAEQLVKLKLIEEIPSFCEVFLENREVMEQADKFFRSLEGNKAKVTSLRQEYSELKEQVTDLQSEVDSNSLTVQEIDEQIAQLKSRRAELTRIIENKKRDRDELTYNQKLVANSIPKVVHEVQLANAKKPEWELKKENAEKREAEILSKFAPLKGFSL